MIVKTGAMVAPRVVETPLRPTGKTNHKVTQDRIDEQEISVDNTYPASADSHASWLKKGGKDPYGYKKYAVTDQEGLVLGVVTTARTNEVSNLEQGFDSANLSERIPVKADKGYPSQKNAELLKKRTRKKRLLKKTEKT